MKNTRLYSLLESLTTKEIKQVKKWLASPFFNQRQDVIDFFEYYLAHKTRPQKAFDKQVIFKQLYPQQAYEDHKLRMVFSLLKRQVEQFLVYQEEQADKAKQRLQLAKIYRARRLEKHAKQSLQQTHQLISQSPKTDHFRLYLDYQYSMECTEHDRLLNRTKDKNYQYLLDQIDQYYITRKLFHVLSCLLHEYHSEFSYDYGAFDTVLLQIKQQPQLLNHPLVDAYYASYQAFTQLDNKALYFNYKQKILEHQASIAREDLKYLVQFAIDMCIINSNKGDRSLLSEIQAWHEWILEYHIVPRINHQWFKNMANAGILNQKFDWTERFIEDYRDQLNDEYRSHIPQMLLANLAFHRQEYEKALEIIRSLQVEDTFHLISIKVTQVTCLYKLGILEVATNQLKNFEAFLRRQSMGYKKQYLLNWVSFLQKIIKLNPYDKQAKKQLLQEITVHQQVSFKKWLLSCLE